MGTRKLKEALFYTIMKRWGYSSWEVLAVTTEKRRQFFGRYASDNSGTHVSQSDCVGRFPTQEAAEARIEAIKRVTQRHEPAIKAAALAEDRARQARDTDIERAWKGEIDG